MKAAITSNIISLLLLVITVRLFHSFCPRRFIINSVSSLNPSFYAVIPAYVRYNRRLAPRAIILYGEITALCNKTGYCWAGNAYFARLYNASERSVTNWINALKKAGYITVSFINVPGKKEIQERRVRLAAPPQAADTPPEEDTPPAPEPGPPDAPPHEENREGVVKKISPPLPETQREPSSPGPEPGLQAPPDPPLRKGIPEEVVKKFSPPPEKNFTASGNNFQQVVKNLSKGGENNFGENTKYNNTLNTSSSPPNAAAEKGPPRRKAEEEAPFLLTTEKLKAAFAQINPHLLFDPAFYPRAASFLASRSFGAAYLRWLYEFCLRQNPKKLAGYYFNRFFAEQSAELFRLYQKESSPPPLEIITCPVCGLSHAKADPCSRCGLRGDPSPQEAAQHKRYWNLPAEKKSAYDRGFNDLLASGLDFNQKNKAMNRLRREFGLTHA
jgi:hypothetical protein